MRPAFIQGVLAALDGGGAQVCALVTFPAHPLSRSPQLNCCSRFFFFLFCEMSGGVLPSSAAAVGEINRAHTRLWARGRARRGAAPSLGQGRSAAQRARGAEGRRRRGGGCRARALGRAAARGGARERGLGRGSGCPRRATQLSGDPAARARAPSSCLLAPPRGDPVRRGGGHGGRGAAGEGVQVGGAAAQALCHQARLRSVRAAKGERERRARGREKQT